MDLGVIVHQCPGGFSPQQANPSIYLGTGLTMTQLSGKQIGEIQEALLDAFPARDDLRMMVRIELDETLEAIADGSNQRVVIFNLVSWAERTGRIDDLVQGAYRQNQGNPALRQLMATWRAAAPPAADQAASRVSAPATSGPVSIDLFLSYSRKNLPAMRTAKESLRAAGLAVWTDEGLEPGTESWRRPFRRRWPRRRRWTVLLSPEAKASTWVEREVDLRPDARQAGVSRSHCRRRTQRRAVPPHHRPVGGRPPGPAPGAAPGFAAGPAALPGEGAACSPGRG